MSSVFQLGMRDVGDFPTTRYQGSKLKLLDWIWASIQHLSFDTALDLFGGTGCVGYLFKTKGKSVTYSDYLRSNQFVGKALIENGSTNLSDPEVQSLFEEKDGVEYDDFIQRTFRDVFFLTDENRWLDIVAQNIRRVRNPDKKALAYFALFQACIAKRPYNLFHRANLYMRTSQVKRSFGNKTTWDKPFEVHFARAVMEANQAVFDNGRRNTSVQASPEDLPPEFDLVYIDPPYMNSKGVSVDYLEFYHFLEGLTEYRDWPTNIACQYKHKPYKRRKSPWCDKNRIHQAFDEVFARFSHSLLVVSYRDNGIPTPPELISLLKRHKRHVYKANQTRYKYVLSKAPSNELLFIAE